MLSARLNVWFYSVTTYNVDIEINGGYYDEGKQ